MPVLSNAKHELFCQHLALGKTASEAYEMAGYKPSRSNASVLRANQNVSDRLSEILQQSERKVVQQIEYTRDSILAELDEARKMAIELKNPSAAWQAAMAKAKLLGLVIDRREVGNVGPFDDMTDEELISAAARKARELGIAGPREIEDENKKSALVGAAGRRHAHNGGWHARLGVSRAVDSAPLLAYRAFSARH
jgi:hypothetical protein